MICSLNICMHTCTLSVGYNVRVHCSLHILARLACLEFVHVGLQILLSFTHSSFYIYSFIVPKTYMCICMFHRITSDDYLKNLFLKSMGKVIIGFITIVMGRLSHCFVLSNGQNTA